MHPETAIDPATAPAIRQHVQESVLVNVVLALIQAFSCALIGGTETVVGLAAQPNKSVAAPLDLEQPGSPLVVRLASDATRIGGCPRESGETSLDVVVFVLSTTFSRKPVGTVPEIVLAKLWSDEIVDAFTRQCYIGGVGVHFTVLVEWSLDVSTIETAHSISTNERSSDIILNSVICAKYINIKTSLPVYEVVVELQHTELGVLIDEETDV